MTKTNTTDIARQTAPRAEHLDGQVVQTSYRMRLVNDWGIPAGARVLEIGCGQGDTTAALAHVVGAGGYVTAVDSAPPSYGAPTTLGEAAAHLLATPLGKRIDVRLQHDPLDPRNSFSADEFDYVVFAHCSWYFDTPDQLARLLARVRPWARRLCFAEWDMEPRELSQIAHLLAVSIQGHLEAYKTDSSANVRTPLARQRMRRLLSDSGWRITSDRLVDTAGLQDAAWEIDACLQAATREADALGLPGKTADLLNAELDVLRQFVSKDLVRPLPAYSIAAERLTDPTATALD